MSDSETLVQAFIGSVPLLQQPKAFKDGAAANRAAQKLMELTGVTVVRLSRFEPNTDYTWDAAWVLTAREDEERTWVYVEAPNFDF